MIILSRILIAALLGAAPFARADETGTPAVSTAPVAQAPASVIVLKDRFIESQSAAERTKVLDQLAKTAPVSGQDVANLFDLFTRFTDDYTRKSVMASLALLGQGNPQLEPMFMTYIRQPEPESQLFGINGAFRLRARTALPLIRALAEKKFSASAVTETTMMTERNAWWTQYEALSILAQWEGEKSFSLLERKGQESAKVGSLLGRYYWRQTLPKLRAWSESGDLIAAERAALAVTAPISLEDARATRAQMLALLRDAKVDAEIRHLLALKIGASSTSDEAADLVREHDAAKNEAEKLYWAAAAFSTRDPKVIPLLVRYAQTGDERMRKGAAIQLGDMVGEAEARKLIEPEKIK